MVLEGVHHLGVWFLEAEGCLEVKQLLLLFRKRSSDDLHSEGVIHGEIGICGACSTYMSLNTLLST